MWFKLTGDERLRRCSTEDCGGQQTWRLEVDGIGSNYCSGCKAAIDVWDEEQEAEERLQDEMRELESREMEAHFERYPHG